MMDLSCPSCDADVVTLDELPVPKLPPEMAPELRSWVQKQVAAMAGQPAWKCPECGLTGLLSEFWEPALEELD